MVGLLLTDETNELIPRWVCPLAFGWALTLPSDRQGASERIGCCWEAGTSQGVFSVRRAGWREAPLQADALPPTPSSAPGGLLCI